MIRTRILRLRIGALAMGLLATPAALPYERPLTSHSIWEAHFLGRRHDDKTFAFLAQYVKRFPVPKSGPHVAEVELRTPYVQVVQRSSQYPDGSSAQQAEQDYRARPDLILVRVQINLTPSYSAQVPDTSHGKEGVRMRPNDFWRDFSIRFVQRHEIAPRKVSGKPLYRHSRWGSWWVGAEVVLEFDAAQVASAPARIEVIRPDGNSVEAEFDLDGLK